MSDKPTKGPWTVKDHGDGKVTINSPDWGAFASVYVCVAGEHDPEGWANAQLIAEAGTVYHETGKSPREMQEQIKQLREALVSAARVLSGEEMTKQSLISALEQARAALSAERKTT